jgi:hypothetical protein
MGAIPSVERVDVVELEPAILRVARDAAPVNEHVLDNPKVHIHLADAREYLRTTPNRYDVIFSEPSNPYRAGISSLYTVEYYRAAAQRVAPGGLFVQWMQAYEVDGWAVATVMNTLRNVFGDVEVWQTMTGDLLMMARAEHVKLDVVRLRTMLEQEPYSRAARAVWATSSAEGVLGHFVARSDLADLVVKHELGALNTDDQNFLEFAFARSVGRAQRVDVDLGILSRRLRTSLPDAVGDVDRTRVQEERWLFQMEMEAPLSPLPASYPAGKLGPVLQAFRDRQYAVALRLWKELHREGTEAYLETKIVAECAAAAGEGADLALVERVPGPDGDLFRALWHVRHHEEAAATEALIRAFVAARTNPWMGRRELTSAISLASTIALAERKHARALYDALREPFAVEASREHRLLVAAKIAALLPDPACVEGLRPLEPPQWDRSLLELRVACYSRTGNPLATPAAQDLLLMRELDAHIGESIPSPPRPPKPKAAPAPAVSASGSAAPPPASASASAAPPADEEDSDAGRR